MSGLMLRVVGFGAGFAMSTASAYYGFVAPMQERHDAHLAILAVAEDHLAGHAARLDARLTVLESVAPSSGK